MAAEAAVGQFFEQFEQRVADVVQGAVVFVVRNQVDPLALLRGVQAGSALDEFVFVAGASSQCLHGVEGFGELVWAMRRRMSERFISAEAVGSDKG
jgi:hypothetical protein